jgi:hypothetical protein
MPYRIRRRPPPLPASDPAARGLDRKFGTNGEFLYCEFFFFLAWGSCKQRVQEMDGRKRDKWGNAGFK